MLARRVDIRKKSFQTIPISYLIQTANQFQCEIYVRDRGQRVNVKRYEEMKNLKTDGFLTFYFKGSDEREAQARIRRILQKDI